MNYSIMIDESQRIALLNLVQYTDDNALECWKEMLEDLPKEEAENPKILHGFCL